MHYDLCVVGGLGHVGLPLSMAFASKGLKVCAFDISQDALKTVRSGKLPFIEYDAEPILTEVLANGTLTCSDCDESISAADVVIMVTGTPVDSHLSPDFDALLKVFQSYRHCLRDGQLIILRSTVYPGTTHRLQAFLKESGLNVDVAFCPERIAEGYAMRELTTLPHIISAVTPTGAKRAEKLFAILHPETVILEPLEAEMAKLFTNVYRYVKFAIANQFFTIANESGLDYYRIHNAIKHKYPRAADLPAPGFAAGPCLYKDTIQLSAFNNHTFFLGHASLLVNEGLPHYVVDRLRKQYDLSHKTVGILGMAFKADVDDPRDSLAYKLRKILAFETQNVLCSDTYICDPEFVSTEELIRRSDIIIVGAPHKQYKNMQIEGKVVVDIWNIFGKGCQMSPDLSVVVPVYNEGENIVRLFDEIDEKAGPLVKEVVLVYDFEEDDTLPAVQQVADRYPFPIRPIRNAFGRGALNAIRTGFKEAKGPAVLVCMADLSDDLTVLEPMLQGMREGCDVVCGSRYMRGGRQIGGPLLKRTLSRLAGVSLYWLAGVPTHDVTNSFKMYRKELLDRLTIESTGGFEIGMEIIVKTFAVGGKIAEVPSTWTDRTAGTSRFRMWKWMPSYLRWYWFALKNRRRRRR